MLGTTAYLATSSYEHLRLRSALWAAEFGVSIWGNNSKNSNSNTSNSIGIMLIMIVTNELIN